VAHNFNGVALRRVTNSSAGMSMGEPLSDQFTSTVGWNPAARREKWRHVPPGSRRARDRSADISSPTGTFPRAVDWRNEFNRGSGRVRALVSLICMELERRNYGGAALHLRYFRFSENRALRRPICRYRHLVIPKTQGRTRSFCMSAVEKVDGNIPVCPLGPCTSGQPPLPPVFRK